jgi:hypothetical protein
MNTQTLNRMIKASYSAPNGAQLRKACYGLLSVKSRRASENPAVALEQIEELPKQEQAKVKADIIAKALVEESAKDQAKLEPYGLKDVKKFVAQNHLTPEAIEKEVENVDPMVKRSVEDQISSPKEAVSLASTVIRSRTFEELADYLDMPFDWLQSKIENINYFKIVVVCIAIKYVVLTAIGAAATGAGVGTFILVGIYFVAKKLAIPLIIYYFFGNVIDWIQKRFNMLLSWVLLLVPRVFITIFKGMGWLIDSVLHSLKGAFSRFFSRQAKIAMQSPQFRKAYYSI